MKIGSIIVHEKIIALSRLCVNNPSKHEYLLMFIIFSQKNKERNLFI